MFQCFEMSMRHLSKVNNAQTRTRSISLKSFLDPGPCRFRDEDVLIMTFPRSGTTWTQELVWCMMHDLDFDTASSTPLPMRSPFIEYVNLHYIKVLIMCMVNHPLICIISIGYSTFNRPHVLSTYAVKFLISRS